MKMGGEERWPTREAIRTRLFEHAMPGLDKLVLSSNVCRHFSLARPKSTHNCDPPRPRNAHAEPAAGSRTLPRIRA